MAVCIRVEKSMQLAQVGPPRLKPASCPWRAVLLSYRCLGSTFWGKPLAPPGPLTTTAGLSASLSAPESLPPLCPATAAALPATNPGQQSPNVDAARSSPRVTIVRPKMWSC